MQKANSYRLFNNSAENLKSLGFRLRANGAWQKRFSAYKYKGETTIEAVLTVFEDNKEVFVDLYCSDGMLYAPYYHQNENTLSDNLVLVQCGKRIRSVMKNCGIKNK